MRLAAVQSCYLPWRGYFDLIDSADLFLIADVMPFSRHSFRNRNRLRFADGTNWITVPVTAHGQPPIDQVQIAAPFATWTAQHRGKLGSALGRAPYFSVAAEIWHKAVPSGVERLTDLNESLIRAIAGALGIRTQIERLSRYVSTDDRTDRIIRMMKEYLAQTYVTGPAALSYLDLKKFAAEGLCVEVKTYDYEVYDQRWQGYDGHVSILDTVANAGLDRSRTLIRSSSPGRQIV